MSKDLSSSGSGKNKIIHTIVILALFFLFRYIPPFGSVTEVGMAVLGIFLGAFTHGPWEKSFGPACSA